jgi:MFS family permease
VVCVQVMEYAYPGSEGDSSKSLIATSVLVGSVLGQLGFGAVADRVGRRAGFITTLALVTCGALLSAFSHEVCVCVCVSVCV